MAASIPVPTTTLGIQDAESHSVENYSIHSLDTDIEANRHEEKDVTEVENGEEKEKGVLGGVVTRTSTKSSWKDPGPPPDGGTTAWLQGEFYFFGM
jgi:hypothetical protein